MCVRLFAFAALLGACSQPLQPNSRTGSDDDFLGTFSCGQNGQACCAGQTGAACLPGSSCQYGTCVPGAGDAGLAPASCGALGQACCALADGSQRCQDGSLSCDGITLTCVAASADEVGGDTFGSKPGRGASCVVQEGSWAGFFTSDPFWDTHGVCRVTSPDGTCAGTNKPGVGSCSGTQVKCCPSGSTDWVAGSQNDGPSTSEGEEAARCRDARADSNAQLDLECRYSPGEACGGGRTCVNTSNVNETDCRSLRCDGGSSMMCCKTTTTSSGSDAGPADGGSTPTDVNRRSEGQTCDFTGDGAINSTDNAVCTSDTSGRSCVSLRCLNAGHAVRCCRPRSGSSTDDGGSSVPNGVGASCNQRQSDGSFKTGVCVQVNSSGESSQCFDRPVSGLCPGPSTVRCCLD